MKFVRELALEREQTRRAFQNQQTAQFWDSALFLADHRPRDPQRQPGKLFTSRRSIFTAGPPRDLAPLPKPALGSHAPAEEVKESRLEPLNPIKPHHAEDGERPPDSAPRPSSAANTDEPIPSDEATPDEPIRSADVSSEGPDRLDERNREQEEADANQDEDLPPSMSDSVPAQPMLNATSELGGTVTHVLALTAVAGPMDGEASDADSPTAE
jgi:hypothetical protein